MKLNIPLKRIHFVGIGGIGMSAIAEMLDDFGVRVQGSDIAENANVLRLRKKGIPVAIGHAPENIQGADAIVVSTAAKLDNPERIEAEKRGIPVAHRSEMLAEILKYKQSICISGTHGKTTTSSLIASILIQANKRPSFIIGGILNAHASNARLGKGNIVIAEADESDGSFLKLPTTVSVITNIDPEHMDFYRSFDRVKDAYEMFIRQTAFYGFSVACTDHPVVREVCARVAQRKIISYGLNKDADVHADNIRCEPGQIFFDAFVRTGAKFHKIKDVKLSLMGLHNVQNALASIAVCSRLGIDDKTIKKALAGFQGIQRRLTCRGVIPERIAVYDDYAHHPVEIRATLQALRSANKGKIIAIFQPHRYTRLRDLWQDFLSAFAAADIVWVCDVYGAGEEPIPLKNAAQFADDLAQIHPHARFVPAFDALPGLVGEHAQNGDCVVCLGAGSISAQSVQLVKALKGKIK